MIKLYQFPTRPPLPNPSPFCFRVEAFLRLVDLPYAVVAVTDTRKAPKKKLPFIFDDQGKAVADSQAIIEHLTHSHELTLDNFLSDADRAVAHAFTKMLTEHLYWVMVFARWIDEAGWATFKPNFLKILPPVIGPAIAAAVRAKTRKSLLAQGIGRHTPAEIWRLGEADIDALAVLLGDRDFFFGDQPCSFDATALAFLGWILYFEAVDPPIRQHLRAHPNLTAYCLRMMQRCFPELVEHLPQL
jgi:glutathione S-transferase